MTEVYRRGETVPIWVYVEDWASAFTNPSEGIRVTAYDSAGVKKVDNQLMSIDEAGKQVYYYDSEVTDEAGLWRYNWTAVDGVGDGAKTQIGGGSFTLI